MEHAAVPAGRHRSIELSIPPGYEAHAAAASVAAPPEMAKWLDWTDYKDTSGDGVDQKVGWHQIVAGVQVGGRTLLVSTDGDNTVDTQPHAYRSFWLSKEFVGGAVRRIDLDQPLTQKATVGGVVGGTYNAAVSVVLICRATDATKTAWAADIYTQLRAAYDALLDRWKRDQDAGSDPPMIAVSGSSPARHAEMVREELRRQVIEMLGGGQFDGMPAMAAGTATDRPRADIDLARRQAPLIQFLEQAFEWSTMTYICYPYYWADSAAWPELEPIESADPEFDRFLRSGSARVVVPARPGFAQAVNHFMLFGRPWGGGPAPVPGDELYVSVAQEIKELNGAPDDGEPGESWEARVPTTLVWLDSDPTLPKQNSARRLTAPPNPICT